MFLEELDPSLCNSVSGRCHNKRLAGAVSVGEVERRRRLTAKEMLGLGLDSGF